MYAIYISFSTFMVTQEYWFYRLQELWKCGQRRAKSNTGWKCSYRTGAGGNRVGYYECLYL